MVQSTQTQQQLYTHAVEPKAVQQRKAKYREDEAVDPDPNAANIMFDRRVVRGNTYAARILPAEAMSGDKKPSGSLKKRGHRTAPPRSTDAVDGRRHIDVQTDAYLEELTDTTPEVDNTTQTDAFLDRPATPLFVPQKTGVDATTQIENGDLFDFDFEVEPLLEVLVGKVLEQGLMEVLQEEELAAMHAHQEHFEAIRNAELVATQRMEAAEMRKLAEKERRLAQEAERRERERVVRQKVAASTFARGYLSGIVSSVFDQLQASSYFFDPVQREVDTVFLPWLQDLSCEHLQRDTVSRQRSVTHATVCLSYRNRGWMGVTWRLEMRLEMRNDAAQSAVVKRLVLDATALLERERHAAAMRQAAARSSAAAFALMDADTAAAAAVAAEEASSGRASFVLSQLVPPPVGISPAAVQAAREELSGVAEAECNAAWEALKAAARDRARESAEAALADQQAAIAEAAAAAAEAAATAGEDPDPDLADPSDPGPPGDRSVSVDVEALISAADASVSRPKVRSVGDGEVLSFMMDTRLVSKDAIVHAMAVHSMGLLAYTQHESYVVVP
ncbi:MAG: hypothetical protein WDW38_001947 [Sanguina aurantia]